MKKTTFLLAALFVFGTYNTNAQVLDIPEVIQEQDQWCWAGCTRSILEYYQHPVMQCEIAEYARSVITWWNFGTTHCCADPDQGCNYWNYNYSAKGSMQDILLHFDSIQNYGVSGTPIPLTKVSSEIAGERPFIIRWGWNTGGGHFIVGHGVSDSMVYYMNPWFGEGLHIANYDWLRNDGKHAWTHTNILTTSPAPKLNTEHLLKQEITVYPNPGEGVFTINTYAAFSERSVLEIIDVLGESIFRSGLIGSLTTIDMTAQAKGVYWLRIKDGDRITVKKIVKL